MDKKTLLIGIGILILLGLGQRLLLSAPEPAPVAAPVQLPDLPSDRPARTSTEALDNTLSALDQLSEAYNLTPEQQQEIRRIIESANYAP